MLLSAKDIHSLLNSNVGINKIRAMMATGEIPSIVIGKKYVAKKIDVERWVNTQFIIKNPDMIGKSLRAMKKAI